MDQLQGMMLRMPDLKKVGVRIHIISPSGVIDPAWVDRATETLAGRGFIVSEGNFARVSYGRFAGTIMQRLSDLQHALDSPDIDVILCSRGGYGLSQVIDKADFSVFGRFPKWIAGFSDITVLHNAVARLGIPGMHAMMSRGLASAPADNADVAMFLRVLGGEIPHYRFDPNPHNRTGETEAIVAGGNLSVLMALRGTPFDLDLRNKILFIEDIGEQWYHIDRMLQNWRMSGALSELAGLIVGQFTDCPDDPSMMCSPEAMILNACEGYSFPVCFHFPAGHDTPNMPLLFGCNARLVVGVDGVSLQY
jgi:muramoyltetrapeptide carboxypeptidase